MEGDTYLQSALKTAREEDIGSVDAAGLLPERFKDIRSLNVFEIEGDFDLFDDGALRLVKAPGQPSDGKYWD